MRGAPHSGFAVAMRVISALISALMGGRPPVVRPESRVQYSRKRRRCHRRTVSGVTMTRDCLQPAQILASADPEEAVRSCVVGAGSSFACRRRAAGARRGSPGRAGDGRRRGRGGAEAGGAGG